MIFAGMVADHDLQPDTRHHPSPAIGVVLFVMARIAGVSFEQISRAILPWLVPLLIVLLAITAWPPLTLWLPNLLMNK